MQAALAAPTRASKAVRVGDGNFAEHLAVQLDIGFFAGIDELAVPDTSLPTRGIQAKNPQTSEISLSSLAVDAGVDCRPHSGFFGLTILVAFSRSITLYPFANPSPGLAQLLRLFLLVAYQHSPSIQPATIRA